MIGNLCMEICSHPKSAGVAFSWCAGPRPVQLSALQRYERVVVLVAHQHDPNFMTGSI